ncbi:hypothetical protein ALGA_0058 [Labilibaculum antarcticum]|uniref:Secretin/TonB short N-terminal domain-containing protein n=2 Tax=Labilibaculum antarcticum TaxID=1717717 RepID=A0A1Y1CEB3_9BACT|nr:hypothetical protein ALGA_0058 [Labilibaculum antarcticum]
MLTSLQLSATPSFALTETTFTVVKSSLSDFFDFLEETTEYKVFYDASEIDLSKEVDLIKSDAPIEKVLEVAFNGTSYTYELVDRHVIIKNNKKGNLQDKSSMQNTSVNGNVVDSKGLSLPGVTIIKKGTTEGTVSNIDGDYTLANISEGDVLVFSFVGMISKEIKITNQNEINVTLDYDAIGLEEVIAIGYGVQKKANMTGAVSMVANEAIERRPVQNAAQALQGQVPGLVISQSSGIPGAEGLNMTIRGLNSFGSGNSPLVLIDGVEGNLADLDPSVIESVNVLKDASSAAIYGLKAANGVLLIQTKTGGKDEITVSYEGSYAISKPTMLPEMITNSVDYMNLYNRSLINSQGSATGGYPDEVIQAYGNANGNPLYPNTDWTNLVLKNGSVKRQNIGINGTSGKTSYNLSVSSWNQEGMVVETDYNKYNFFMNFKTAVTDKIDVGGSFMGLSSDRKGPDGDWGSSLLETWRARPTWGPYTADGSGHYAGKAFSGSTNDPDGLIFDEGFTRENPMISIYGENGFSEEKYNFNGNLFAKISLLDNLVFEAKGAYKFDFTRSKNQELQQDEYNFRTGEYNRTTRDPSRIDVGNSYSKLVTFFSTLTYNASIQNHDFKIMAGYSQEERKYEFTNSTRFGVASKILTELNGAGTDNQLTSGTTTESSVRSGFSRFNYALNDKYLFEVNLRVDASSKFAEGNRVGVFPSLSVGWRLESEPFIQKFDFIHQLKLRASWGQLGNDGSNNYPYQSRYAFGNYDAGNYVSTHTSGSHGYPFGSSITSGVVLENLTNADITWETTTITDIGLDFSTTNGLFTANVDYYKKVTTDILRQLQVSIGSGTGGPQVNSGEMKNEGWDIVLGHNNKIGEVSYHLGTNFSWYKNELVSYGAAEIGDQTINEEGQPYNDYYMWEADGYFNTQADIDNAPTQPKTPYLGGIRLKDNTGDGVVDRDDRIHIDGKHPDLLYGVNLSAKYKNFELGTFWQGVVGKKTYRWNHGVEPFNQDGNTPKVWFTDSWTADNTNAKLPAVYNESLSNYSASNYTNSFWLQNTSYFRMKNITLSYSIPKSIVERIKLKSALLYFSGDNLLTFSDDNIFDVDPEINNSFTNPIPKSYTFGLKVTL